MESLFCFGHLKMLFISRLYSQFNLRIINLPKPINGRVKQLFVNHSLAGHELITPPEDSFNLLKDDNISLVFQGRDKFIYKFIKPRRWHEYYKAFYGRSRTSKEVYANLRLKELGIKVPFIHEYSIAMVPTHFRGFTGYYIMEPAEGIGNARPFINELSDSSRKAFINQLLKDLEIMRKNRIIYSDLSLGNLFCGREGELCWIDTAIKEYSRFSQKKFEKNWDKTMAKFMSWEKKAKTLNENELSQLEDVLCS